MKSTSDVTFDYLLDAYLKYHSLRPSSEKNYRNVLARLGREMKISLL